MRKTGRVFILWSSILNATGTFWLLLIMLIIVTDVVGRVFLGRPLTGTPEIVKLSIVGVTFIQLPHSVYMDHTIRSDAILNRLGPVPREIVTMISYIFGVALCLAIIISSWSHTIHSWQILEYEGEGALRVPAYPVRTLILVGALTTAIHFLLKFSQSLIELFGRFKGRSGHES